jgi:DNA modification methylase
MQEKEMIIDGQRVLFNTSEDMSALADSSVDFIITSPPYWNLKNYGQHPEQLGSGSYERYLDRLNVVWEQCYKKAKENAVMIININSRRVKHRYYPIPFDIVNRMKKWTLWDVMFWYIPNALPQPNSYMERLFDNKVEYLLTFTKNHYTNYTFNKPRVPQKYIEADPRQEKKNPRGRCLGNVFRIPAYRPPNVKKLNYHEAAFPEELVALCLKTYTNPGNIVLDPFLGSGTTLKVARIMGRQGIGYEINDSYADLIRTRISETWELPDWREIDLIHSTTLTTGMKKPRKVHFQRETMSLFPVEE